MQHSKKAMSPLIAAVLLIVIVVGIGSAIMGIARQMITENKKSVDTQSGAIICANDIAVDLVIIDSVPQICASSSNLEAVIENTGTADIDDFQVTILGEDGLFRNESVYPEGLERGQGAVINVSFSGVLTSGGIEQVRIVPKIRKLGESGHHYCNDVAIKYESIADCPLN